MNDSAVCATTGSKKTILVVDDAASVAELISEMLLSFGYQPEICLTVKDARAKFESAPWDLVITDYTMPVMNGIDFAKALRLQIPNQLILLITGSNYSIGASLAHLPINATLQKPFSVDEFQRSVANLLATEKTPA